jgi:hypothetical protein
METGFVSGWVKLAQVGCLSYSLPGSCFEPSIPIPQCLQHGTFDWIPESVQAELHKEIDYLDGKRPCVSAAVQQAIVTITLMSGQRFTMPVEAQTTIKDLKVFLGTMQKREPRYYRLLLNGKELKVRMPYNFLKLLKIITGQARDQQTGYLIAMDGRRKQF